MRPSERESEIITSYLVDRLKSKKFSVITNRYGIIVQVEKRGIKCCPSIVDSEEDGRHGYSYLINEMGSSDIDELGYYFKPHSSESPKYIKNSVSIDKYTVDNKIKIDLHNYINVINSFVDDLDKDYSSTVHSLKEDSEEITFDEYEAPVRCQLLADCIGVDASQIEKTDDTHYIVHEDDGEDKEYQVLTDSDADDRVERLVDDELSDPYLMDNFDIDLYDILDEYRIKEWLEEDVEDQVNEMPDDELIKEAVNDDIVSLDDKNSFKIKDDVDTEDVDFDRDDADNYDCLIDMDDLRDRVTDYKVENMDAINDFMDIFGKTEVERMFREHMNDSGTTPWFIDDEKLRKEMSDIIASDRGYALSGYDGYELYLGKDEGEDIYAYRLD